MTRRGATAENMREMRLARGWLQRDLETRAGLPQGTICQMETEYRGLSIGNAIKIADAFKVSLDALVGRRQDEDVDAKWRRKIAGLLE